MKANHSIIVIVLALSLNAAAAQEQGDKFSWKSSSTINKDDGSVVNTVSEFIWTVGQSISWIQNVGAKTYDFEITGVTGSWSDFEQDGSIVVQVTRSNTPGELRFTRNQGIYKIEMDFRQDGRNIMPYEFTISTVNEIQQ